MRFNIVDFLNIHKIRYMFFKRRLKSCGDYVRFSSGVKLFTPRKIVIGENVHVGNNCIFSGMGGINIGNNVSFGPQVMVWSVNHNVDAPEKLPYDDVRIEKEVNISIFKDKHDYVFSEIEEPIFHNDILGFDEKYRKNSGGFQTIKRKIPAEINDTTAQKIKDMALLLYKKLDMFGVVRFDFIIDKNGNVYVNEVNTIPGSLANYLYKDFNYKQLLDKTILSSLIRYDESKIHFDRY